MATVPVILLLIGAACCQGAFRDGNERALLKDMNVLTLYHGKMTTARRSSPVPQLKCVGGTAECSSFVPQVVQCYNRGSDGYDVQWECKTDMDNAYRFGRIEVNCEGHDYPDDVYVLRGSCGLEYTLDLTKEGFQQKKAGQQHSYYGDQQGHPGSYSTIKAKGSSVFGDLIMLVIVGGVIYAIYRTCLGNVGTTGEDGSIPRDTHRGPSNSRPPPPGFRSDYMPNEGCSSTYDNTYTSSRHMPGASAGGAGAGGFWTGAATGGLLGYMFGSRTNTGYHQPYAPHRRGWGSGWGSSGWGSGWGSSTGSSWGSTGSSFGSSSSSGTRTASGFGGTRRR